MSLADALIAELKQEAAGTRKVLARVPDDKLGWRPHAKSMSLGELSYHIAVLPRAIANLLSESAVDVPTPRLRADTPAADLVRMLDESVGIATAKLAEWGDEGLRAPWSMLRGGKVVLELPRSAGVRAIMLNHWYHHRGQLTVYLRLLDVPLPALYGSSADERPLG
ncbi:MAG TPA: DinB family protein [Thermoanaerobaculia bacterium]